MTKSFRYDELLDIDNICNLTKEKQSLEQAVIERRKLVVYGRRNSGKTSVVKNSTVPFFQKKYAKPFVFFADLMETKDMTSLCERLHRAFEFALSEALPMKSLMKKAVEMLGNLRPHLTFDELSGKPLVTIEPKTAKKTLHLSDVFSIIQKQILPQFEVLIVLDEFQDIAPIPEAQGLLRNSFQQLGKASIILMGSKQHMLADLFAKPQASLARFGEDLVFSPIPYEEFHEYMLERFKPHGVSLSLQTATLLQDLLFRDAEAINIVCHSFVASHFQGRIKDHDIRVQIAHTISARGSRFETYLAQFSEKEQKVLSTLAQMHWIKHPSAKEVCNMADLTARGVQWAFRKFMDHSVIEKLAEGYRIQDPLLFYYLQQSRKLRI